MAVKAERRSRQGERQGGGGDDLLIRRCVCDADFHLVDYPANYHGRQVRNYISVANLEILWHNQKNKRVDGKEYIRRTAREPAVGVKRVSGAD